MQEVPEVSLQAEAKAKSEKVSCCVQLFSTLWPKILNLDSLSAKDIDQVSQ